MSDDWSRFGWRRPGVIATEPLTETIRAQNQIPKTLHPLQVEGAVQRPIFDPSLKQYANAYRAGDPRFADESTGRAWYAARRTAMDLVLAAIAGSEWVDSLVLRGSVLLKAWFPGDAREPGDLDFVVTPADWTLEEPSTDAMINGIARAAQAVSEAEGGGTVRFDAAGATSDDIWTYERVPGRRLVLPWTAPGLPGGIVQLDFVFGEHLPAEPEPTLVPAADGSPGALVTAASPELSLAWKLMWLISDSYPQGKDLYDAVLLAEHTPLRYSLLRDVFLHVEPQQAMITVEPRHITDLQRSVGWGHFVAEFPDLADRETEYVQRLAAALGPTFHTAGPLGAGPGSYQRRVAWLEPWTDRYRATLLGSDLPTVLKKMAAKHTPITAAVVIIRELLGPENTSIEQTYETVVEHPDWQQWPQLIRQHPNWFGDELKALWAAQ